MLNTHQRRPSLDFLLITNGTERSPQPMKRTALDLATSANQFTGFPKKFNMSVKRLLKQSNPEHAHNATMHSSELDTEPQQATLPRADPLDDVFGSDDTHDSPVFVEDPDDDDWLSQDTTPQHHPSDMHRLRQEHTTAGYRDGVTVAKASSIQAGFDEGFGLGATIGLKVGRLLGYLEGIAGALQHAVPGAEEEGASRLLSDARAELDVRTVFSEVYWHADGTWKYEVDEHEGEVGAGALLFSHVAEAHPLVRKWTAVVEAQIRTWGLREQLPLLQRREDGDEPAGEPLARAKVATQTQAEAKVPSGALSW